MGKPSLLVVSPLPPAWSGVANYTARLLPHLGEVWRLTIVVGDGEPADAVVGVDDGMEIVHASSWRWLDAITSHDRILHCLGNSQFHRHVPPLVARHGGVVLAHEIRMNGLQCLRALQAPDPHFISAMVHERYGRILGGEIRVLEDDGGIARQFHTIRARLDEANAYLLEPAVCGADAVAVHSEYAAALARLECRSGVPVHAVPFGHPAGSGPAPGSPTKATITSFGFVAREKHAELLLDAFAVLAADHPGVQLRYAGHVYEPHRDELIERARRLGVERLVVFTGRLSDAEYAEELRRATVAVQLRASANGEASAAIADCLSHGLATIVTRLGAQAELPADAVEVISPAAGPADVAAAIHRVLVDERRRGRMSSAARRHAAACSFARAAEALTSLLLSSPPTR